MGHRCIYVNVDIRDLNPFPSKSVRFKIQCKYSNCIFFKMMQKRQKMYAFLKSNQLACILHNFSLSHDLSAYLIQMAREVWFMLAEKQVSGNVFLIHAWESKYKCVGVFGLLGLKFKILVCHARLLNMPYLPTNQVFLEFINLHFIYSLATLCRC